MDCGELGIGRRAADANRWAAGGRRKLMISQHKPTSEQHVAELKPRNEQHAIELYKLYIERHMKEGDWMWTRFRLYLSLNIGAVALWVVPAVRQLR